MNIQMLITATEKTSPNALPKKSLYKAPVKPIKAEMSIFNNINIRPKSMGFRHVNARMGFSKGKSLKEKRKNKMSPS